jgi:alkaline phosphatase D
MSRLAITRRAALLAGLGAPAAASAAAAMGPRPAAASFLHGVASGDPLGDRVVIWTRATPAGEAIASVPLRWVVAHDGSLRDVAAEGEISADAANDFCAKVDVTGLEPGRVYFYGFFAGDAVSPVGRARTLPEGSVDRLKLAVFSCSNYPFGRFHAYADMAARGDVDLAIHLGDYIYEYGGESGWGWAESQQNGRVHEPQREIVSLEDYRTRYRQYRTDPDLQAAHAAAPWIVSWDDHEIANNPWTDGAQNHNEGAGEGTWADRKAAALRAFFEWMPIRAPEPGRAREAIWRRLDFGDLVTLVMLETRLTGRTRQLEYGRDMPRSDAGPDVTGFLAKLNDPSRQMIDAAQEAWLVEAAADAEARGAWTIVGDQIVFARQSLFDFGRHYDASTIARMSENGYVASLIERGRLGLPANLDSWDGYPVQRDRITDALSAARAHAILLAGDNHAFWVNEVRDTGGVRCAAEFATTGVTSPGYGDDFAGVEPPIADVFAEGYSEVRYTDGDRRGYLLLTLTPEEAVCDLVATSHPSEAETRSSVLRRFVQRRRDANGVLPTLEERRA